MRASLLSACVRDKCRMSIDECRTKEFFLFYLSKKQSKDSPPACKPMKPTGWKRARRGCSAYAALIITAAKAGLGTIAVSTRSSSINNFSRILERPIWRIITGSRYLVKGKTQ